ncbi:hypothetical protein K8O67_03610 [Leptospira borgpetersenii]|nr:hypothetical protein K8O67_03610 [Leptospira borgpetersenii]UOZ22746.1 hypothetical protein K8O65_03640 [Leptospira borgpetersenii]UOZ25704.1 hypothetical protein K8O64_03645 [Leptospira borgpetersenii]UOZ28676.1 hypothetical protein K8O66_03640 [Leptospira borgpetersenii serovar Hardjo]UVA63565.1 hypothetical protein LH336_12680 [Leptospira borgpetersenii]
MKALYWFVMTLATVGYGDVFPVTTNQRIYVSSGNLLWLRKNRDRLRCGRLEFPSFIHSVRRIF